MTYDYGVFTFCTDLHTALNQAYLTTSLVPSRGTPMNTRKLKIIKRKGFQFENIIHFGATQSMTISILK